MNIFFQYFKITLFSIIISFYSFEFYLNIYDPDKNLKQLKKSYKLQSNNDFDERSPIEIYNDLNKHTPHVMYVPPSIYKNSNNSVFPLAGISYKDTIHCNENGYYSVYTSDRYGFNNPDYEWDKKEIDFLLVGDSFTHGACVNRPNDIASNLRLLSDKNVLNLGYSGNGPLIELATLREYSYSEVKNILWIYYEGNDLYDLNSELNDPTLIKYLQDDNFSQNLLEKQIIIDKLNNENINKSLYEFIPINELKKDSELKYKILKFIRLDKSKNKIKFFLQKKNKNSEIEIKSVLINFKKILKKVEEQASLENANFYFVYLPDINRYKKDQNNFYYFEVMDILNELNIKVINIKTDFLDKESKPLKYYSFETFPHFDENGYKKITQIIYNSLRQ